MFQSWKDFLQISSSCQWMRWTIVRWPSYPRSISGTVKLFRTRPSLWLCQVCRGIGINLNLRASVFGCVNGILVHSNKHLSFNQLKQPWLTEIAVEWPFSVVEVFGVDLQPFWVVPENIARQHRFLSIFISMAFGLPDYQTWPEPKRFVSTVRSSLFGGRPVGMKLFPPCSRVVTWLLVGRSPNAWTLAPPHWSPSFGRIRSLFLLLQVVHRAREGAL